MAALAGGTTANLPDSDGTPYTYVVAPLSRNSFSNRADQAEGDAGAFDTLSVLLLGMGSIVLLIACLNLANMFLARGMDRRTEMAIRQSLGSGRARLVRQLLTEGLLLALLGGALGLVLAYSGMAWILASLGRVAAPLGALHIDVRPDASVLLVTGAACVVAALLFGLGPAWRVTGMAILDGLKEGGGNHIVVGRGKVRTILSARGLILVGQLALSLVMLTAGGLFVRSGFAAADETPGISVDGSLLVELDASLVGYDEARARDVYTRVLERLRALPQVESAGTASSVPFATMDDTRDVRPVGRPPGEDLWGYYNIVSDTYFESLRLPMLRGRDFTPAEAASDGGNRVAIVSEHLATRLFPDGDAIGRQIELREQDAEPVVAEIVGVVAGIKQRLNSNDPSQTSHVYVPFGQAHAPGVYVHVRTDESADERTLLEAVRNEIRAVDPSLPIVTLTTMRDFLDDNVELWIIRTGGGFFMTLGALALFVAVAGVYGVKAYLISRRTHEIGVRLALGATRRDVLRQMMRESLTLITAGVSVGLLLAFAVAGVLASALYGVEAADPLVFVGAVAFLAAAATLASWLPVRRALRIEPVVALRHE